MQLTLYTNPFKWRRTCHANPDREKARQEDRAPDVEEENRAPHQAGGKAVCADQRTNTCARAGNRDAASQHISRPPRMCLSRKSKRGLGNCPEPLSR
jgi:hypothetical protein